MFKNDEMIVRMFLRGAIQNYSEQVPSPDKSERVEVIMASDFIKRICPGKYITRNLCVELVSGQLFFSQKH
jgi:hypothetical protein